MRETKEKRNVAKKIFSLFNSQLSHSYLNGTSDLIRPNVEYVHHIIHCTNDMPWKETSNFLLCKEEVLVAKC